MALRAFDARDDALVLDLVADSDVGALPSPGTPRRLRFARDAYVLDVLAHEHDDGVQLLLRLQPPAPLTVHASSRRVDLGIWTGAVAGTDRNGVARVPAVPRGLTSLRLEATGHRPLRMAWLRL